MKKLLSLLLMSSLLLCSCKKAETYISENLDKDLSKVESEISNQVDGTTESTAHKDTHTMDGYFDEIQKEWPEKSYYIKFEAHTTDGSDTVPYDGLIYYCSDAKDDILVGDMILLNQFDSFMHTALEINYREDINTLYILIDSPSEFADLNIHGEWIYVDDSTKDYYTFNEDGTGSFVVIRTNSGDDTISEQLFTYTLNNDLLEINFEGYNRTFVFSLKIEDNTLFLTDENGIVETYNQVIASIE